jgi:hypothetical protein
MCRIACGTLLSALNLAPLVAAIDVRVNENREWIKALRNHAEKWKVHFESYLDKAKKIISEHPLLCLSAALIPALLFVVFKYRSSFNVPLYDAVHASAALSGKRFLHKHRCVKCDKVFEHAHVIGDVVESIFNLPVCGDCSLTFKANYDCDSNCVIISSGEGSYRRELNDVFTQEEIEAIRVSRRKDVRDYMICPELSCSGDPKTVGKKVRSIQLSASGDPRTAKLKISRIQSCPIEAEFRADEAANEVSEKIRANMYNIELGDGIVFPFSVKLMFIVGRVGLTVAHLIPFLQNCSHVRISNSFHKEGYVVAVSDLKWERVVDVSGDFKDQLLIEFPLRVSMHQDLMKHIAQSNDMKAKRFSFVLVNPSFNSMVYLKYGLAEAHDVPIVYEDDTRGQEARYSLRKHYQYAIETTSGDCGSVMIGIGHTIQHKILGLHVAGSPGVGYASPLNVVDIQRALALFPKHAQIGLDLSDAVAKFDTSIELPEGNFQPLGKPLYQIPRPVKSVLRPSLISGSISELTTAPSVLKPVVVNGKWIDPLMQGLKKAGQIPPALNVQILKACANDVSRMICTNIDDDHKRVFTNFEAVAGLEGDPFACGITRTTSPGYPLMKETGKFAGKQKWLGSDEYKLDPDIEKEMDRIVEKAKANERSPTIWTDTLKDERRPLEKVRQAKTRVFSAGPMCYTLVFRKYFLGFAAHCSKNRIQNEIAVGTNVYSLDWTRIAEHIQSKGKKVIAGDFSNFDGTLVAEILYAVLDIVNDFYDDCDENKQIRSVLWCEIVNSIHVFGNSVYSWTHSQPSGCPLTAIINSIYNSISMRYVWMKAVPEHFQNMKEFNEHVAMIAYGDDNIVNIADVMIENFNQVSIAEGYKLLGMVYTDEAKSGELIPYRYIDQISFLKREFVFDPVTSLYRAPLAMSTVLEMMNWIRGDVDQLDRTVENVETAMFELSLHPDEIFELISARARKACSHLAHRPQILTLFEYRTSVMVKMRGLCAAS